MRNDRMWAGAGLVSGLALLPLLHLAAVDLESKRASPADYLHHGAVRHVSITNAGSLGLLVTGGVVLFLVGLHHRVGRPRVLLSGVSAALGSIAVLGLVVSFLAAVLAGTAASEGYPYEAVRPMGLLAENAVAVLLPALAGPATLVAVVSLRDRILPRPLGAFSAVLAVLLVLAGVVAPGAGLLVALVWLVLTSAVLMLRPPRAGGTPGSP